MKHGRMIMNDKIGKAMQRSGCGPFLRYYLRICLVGLGKTMEHLSG